MVAAGLPVIVPVAVWFGQPERWVQQLWQSAGQRRDRTLQEKGMFLLSVTWNGTTGHTQTHTCWETGHIVGTPRYSKSVLRMKIFVIALLILVGITVIACGCTKHTLGCYLFCGWLWQPRTVSSLLVSHQMRGLFKYKDRFINTNWNTTSLSKLCLWDHLHIGLLSLFG